VICDLAAAAGILVFYDMPELSGHMLHFAYGEDLSHGAFLKKCPGAEWFGPARMEGHRLVFTSSGRANLKTAAGSELWGALWLVPASALPVLDETAVDGFKRTTRRIVSPAGPRAEATVYVSPKAGAGVPSKGQLAALLASAKENRLPASYIAELKAAGESIEDR
jgi:hypothetical protein